MQGRAELQARDPPTTLPFWEGRGSRYLALWGSGGAALQPLVQRGGAGRERDRGGGGSRRLLGPLVATAPQFTLGSRAASMTDALLPAAPQPLEKENDDYFRKVGGELSDPLCPLKLWSALMGLAAGVGLARRGRGREGDTRGRCGKGERKGLSEAGRPEHMAAGLRRTGARASRAQVGAWRGDSGGPASLPAPVG